MRSHSNIESSAGQRAAAEWTNQPSSYEAASEEYREERRRMWWLLFIADRTLALSINRPTFLQDEDCVNLLQPIDEHVWQCGEESVEGTERADDQSMRPRGASSLFTLPNEFGLLGSLMTVLGRILSYRQSSSGQTLLAWDSQVGNLEGQLDSFLASVRTFDAQSTDAQFQSLGMSTDLYTPAPQDHFRTSKLAAAYGCFIAHVSYLLLYGCWDPPLLLQDARDWSSSDIFRTACEHAIEAANALQQVLEMDPGLNLLADKITIFLLQGSLFFLYYAEKLPEPRDERVTSACETYLRALMVQPLKMNMEYKVWLQGIFLPRYLPFSESNADLRPFL